MADPKIVWYLNEVADTFATDGYAVEVVEAPPGPGVLAAAVGTTQKIITDAVLRADVASCLGIPHFVYFVDGGFSDIVIVTNHDCPYLNNPVNSTVNLSWNVTTSGSTITAADVYIDGVKHGAATGPGPVYTYAWTPTAGGRYSIYLRVTNDLGQVKISSSCRIDNHDVPSIVWSDPTSDLTQDTNLGYTFVWTADVSTASGGEAAARVVMVFSDNDYPTDATYAGNGKWQLALGLPTAGTTSMKARVEDGWGYTAETNTLTLTLEDASAPIISWVDPTSDVTMEPNSTLPLTWNAVADTGRTIAKVEVYRDLGLVGTATDIGGGNYEYIFESSVVERDYTFTAVAEDDVGGRSLPLPFDITVTVATAPDVAYALRWYGAGVADQQFADGQTLQFSDEGMLDGELVSGHDYPNDLRVEDSRLVSVGGAGTSSLRTANLAPVAKGLAVVNRMVGLATANGWRLQINGAVSNANPPNFASLRGDRIFYVESSNLKLVYDANKTDTLKRTRVAVLGGFNNAGEPGDGDEGSFYFEDFEDNGELVLTYVGHDPGLNRGTVYAHVANGGDPDVDYHFIPDADMSSMLTPLVMDTFTAPDDTPLDGRQADVGGVWQTSGRVPMTIQSGAVQVGNTSGVDEPLYQDMGESDVVIRVVATKIGSQAAGPAILLRWLDDNNHYKLDHSTVYRIVKTEAGAGSVVSSTSGAWGVGETRTLVGIGDGDAITFVADDSVVVSGVNAFNQNETKHGMNTYNTVPGYIAEFDNFSVYPRRSQTQYDDAIQPYIDNLGVVAPSNPVKPKYLLEYSAVGLPNQPITGIPSNENNGPARVPMLPEHGALTGDMYMIAPRAAQTAAVDGDKLYGETGDGPKLVAVDVLPEHKSGNTLIAVYNNSTNSGYRSSNIGYYPSNLWAGTSMNSGCWGTFSGISIILNGTTINVGPESEQENGIFSLACVSGGFVSGEPDSTGADGMWIFTKPVTGTQWHLSYGSDTLPTGLYPGASMDRASTANGAGTGLESFVRAYDPLPQLLTPTVLDTFTGGAGTVIAGKAADTGQVWEGSAEPHIGATNQIRKSTNHLAHDVVAIESGMADVVARSIAVTAAAQDVYPLVVRYTDANNWWAACCIDTEIRLAKMEAGGLSFETTVVISLASQYNPHVLIADGDTLTYIANDATVTSVVSTFNQTATKHGMNLWGSGTDMDNLQVLPRRSYSQYDEVLDSYVPGALQPVLVDEWNQNTIGSLANRATSDGKHIWSADAGSIGGGESAAVLDDASNPGLGSAGNSSSAGANAVDLGFADVRTVTTCTFNGATGSWCGVAVIRYDPDTDSGIRVRFNADSSRFLINRYINGVSQGTQYVNTITTYAHGQVLDIKIDCVGTTLNFYVNGTFEGTLEAPDPELVSNTFHGCIGQNNAGVGSHPLKLRIYDLS